jgi:hypothetical protein
MVATFAVLGVALNSQTSIVETNLQVADQELKKSQEDFSINVFADSNELITVNVNNLGQNHVEITSLVITNQTQAPDFPTKIHEIPPETALIVSGDELNILDTMPLTLTLAQAPTIIETYNMKIISSLGTIRTANIACSQTSCEVVAGSGSVSATMILEGTNGINTHNVVAILFVSNNSDETITGLQPTTGFSAPFCDDLWTADDSGAIEALFTEDISPCVVVPGTTVELGPHETTLFKWTGTLAGDIGSTFDFCSTVSGNDSGGPITSPPISCDTLTIINPNECGGCGAGGEGGESVILIDDLLIRPSIFMNIPSPWGMTKGATDTGLWGVNVANPTNSTMTVSKVTIAGIVPGANNLDKIWGISNSHSTGCDGGPINVSPVGSNSWTCPSNNVIMWKNQTDPVSLAPYTMESFNVKLRPGSMAAANTSQEAILIQASVFSSSGSFGKSGYQTTVLDPQAVIGSVFGSTVENWSNDSEIVTNYSGIQYNSTMKFHIVLADTEEDADNSIDLGSRLIVNVPRKWTEVTVISDESTNFNIGATTVTEHGDGSTQIIAPTNTILGDVAAVEAAILTFTTKAPDPETDALYPMYVLADGFSTNEDSPDSIKNFSIGPLSEIILQVDAYDP